MVDLFFMKLQPAGFREAGHCRQKHPDEQGGRARFLQKLLQQGVFGRCEGLLVEIQQLRLHKPQFDADQTSPAEPAAENAPGLALQSDPRGGPAPSPASRGSSRVGGPARPQS